MPSHVCFFDGSTRRRLVPPGRALSRIAFSAAVAALSPSLLACSGNEQLSPLPEPDKPEVAVAPDSPWPKFRQNARQNGRSPIKPSMTGGALWDFKTGKGIFSTPVVAGDGTIYVGSADRYFYALAPDGTLRWKLLTGEIIDSSALLDDKGRVYFGSGDGHLYALDAATGKKIWTFEADPPSVNKALIQWFEGNVAIHPDGTLLVPNDNYFIYSIDRDTGTAKRKLRTPDQTWSLPAVDGETGDFYFGNNNLLALLGANTFAEDAHGTELWNAHSNGSVAASPVITKDKRIVIGGFDGYVRSYDQKTGAKIWEYGARDHIYASPAELSDGTLVQPSADGTIYGLDPASGKVKWAFDTLEAIRSSPAIDADGLIYVGSGEGRLFVLNPDGKLRWAMRLIDDERNDINASPALGKDAVYIAGESGQVFSVPYDYCLRPEGKADSRCILGPKEDLPDDGAEVLFTTQLGRPLLTPPSTIDANQTLAFSLFDRKAGDTQLALLDSGSIHVVATPDVPLHVEVSGDRHFLTVVPETYFTPDADGNVSLKVTGQLLVDPARSGLQFTGGKPGGMFDQTFKFALRAKPASTYPLKVPTSPGDTSSVLEMYRVAAPLPTILPSYNQIGFDSLHYLGGIVEGTPDHFILWMAGAKLAEDENRTVFDPTTHALFPLTVDYKDGMLTMVNDGGFKAVITGTELAFSNFRLTARLDATGKTVETPHLLVSTLCSQIAVYGPFLKTLGFCNTQTDILSAYGAALLRQHEGGVQSLPAGVGTVAFAAASPLVTATLTGTSLKAADHSVSVLLVDNATGKPIALDYGLSTQVQAGADGLLQSVSVKYDPQKVSGAVRAYLMIDTYPAARGALSL